ncbi:MAG: glycosyltransferase family 1 protein [Planctomycetota bacterium]|nr:glycosyltransferase family 1 protein [Planctomycetota bacterium]
MTRAPRVLVSGTCLGQPAGGVRRHNAELLPRVERLLREGGGSLTVMEGRTPVAWSLPSAIDRVQSDVPYQPVLHRAALESRALKRCLARAVQSGAPFDLVHTGHLPAPRRLPVPFTLTVHDLRSLDFGGVSLARRFLGRRVLRDAFSRARRVLYVSEAMRARIVEEFPETTPKLDLIGNGEDHLTRLPRAPSASPFMLHVGHVEPRKNLSLIIEAMDRFPALPRLVLAGAGKGDAIPRLIAAAGHRGLSAKIELLGTVSDETLARLYSTAACAVFPSVIEGFGIGPAEALRAGCPVAASAIPAHLEVSGSGAALFSPSSPDDFARAVMECVGVSTAPAPHAPGHFWDECAARWHEALLRSSEPAAR